ncbi:MAG: hypothetical protein V3U68_03855 [Bacteroidota bacterium]
MALQLNILPVSSVGSLPRPDSLRRARLDFKKGRVTKKKWETSIEQATEHWIRFQEQLGIDVIVSGEFYYFPTDDMTSPALHMANVVLDEEWSYSFRDRFYQAPVVTKYPEYVGPISVRWQQFAQKLTDKPVKNIVIGGYSLMDWSEIADPSLTRQRVAVAYSKAINREILNLAEATSKIGKPVIIQVDEPAASVRPDEKDLVEECVHTALEQLGNDVYTILHTCYSDTFVPDHPKLHEVTGMFYRLPVKQLDLELSKKSFCNLDIFRELKPSQDIGVGAVNVHTGEIEDSAYVEDGIQKAAEILGPERVWIKPDCGMKMLTEDEAVEKFKIMKAVSDKLRKQHGSRTVAFL